MLNLLPKEQKKKIIREYWFRFWIVAFALAFAGEIISLILLVPSYVTVKARTDILNSQSASLKAQSLTIESSNLDELVRKTNIYLDVLNSSSTPVGVISAIKNVVGTGGGAVQISGLFYTINNGQQQIVVTGNAKSRQSLLDFAKKLKTQPGVISADLPVSDFAKAQDIDFSIIVLMNPQKI